MATPPESTKTSLRQRLTPPATGMNWPAARQSEPSVNSTPLERP
ncbi:hypothetical protein [Nocardia terpenica]|nr:hypothetical protein [Nocardia terpenica]